MNGKTVQLRALVLLVCVATASHGQFIRISGQVSDALGAPLANVTVALQDKQLWTSTASDGSYGLDWDSPVVLVHSSRSYTRPSLQNGNVQFSVRGNAVPVRLSLFDARGRLVRDVVRERLGEGSYAVPLGARPMASQLHLVRLQVGGEVTTFRCAAGGTYRSMSGAGYERQSSTMGALAKSVAVSDAVTFSLPGYTSVRVPITTYDTTVSVQMQNENRIAFYINEGSGKVVSPLCTLVVEDSSLAIASVRFTQQVTGGSPQFDAVDPYNPAAVVPGAAMITQDWILSIGGGPKRVYAELTWADTARGTSVVFADVRIAPWNVDVTVRNPMALLELNSAGPSARVGASQPEVLKVESSPSSFTNTEAYHFGRPVIDFSVDIGGDPTFDTRFEYWIVTSDSRAELRSGDHGDPSRYWWEANSVYGEFTGYGAQHDTARVYEYDMQSVTSLRQIQNSTDYPVVDYVDSIAGPPGEMFEVLSELSEPDKFAYGRKEFVLVLRFRGREFGEERLVLLNEPKLDPTVLPWGTIIPETYCHMYLDCHPPKITYTGNKEPFYLANGDTVGQTLNLVLDHASVQDMSYANVTRVDLVVARKPESLVWDYTNWYAQDSVPISVAEIRSLPHEIYPHELAYSSYFLTQISWTGISTMGWPSGEYLVGIVTADEFGNEGFAPVWFDDVTSSTNPLMVTVLSGS